MIAHSASKRSAAGAVPCPLQSLVPDFDTHYQMDTVPGRGGAWRPAPLLWDTRDAGGVLLERARLWAARRAGAGALGGLIARRPSCSCVCCCDCAGREGLPDVRMGPLGPTRTFPSVLETGALDTPEAGARAPLDAGLIRRLCPDVAGMMRGAPAPDSR
jgi:hypothetical protein